MSPAGMHMSPTCRSTAALELSWTCLYFMKSEVPPYEGYDAFSSVGCNFVRLFYCSIVNSATSSSRPRVRAWVRAARGRVSK